MSARRSLAAFLARLTRDDWGELLLIAAVVAGLGWLQYLHEQPLPAPRAARERAMDAGQCRGVWQSMPEGGHELVDVLCPGDRGY